MCWRCELGQISGKVADVNRYFEREIPVSIKSINVEQYKEAIAGATTQSKLALIAYSLLSVVEGEQAAAKWDAIRAQRPESPSRVPVVGETLYADGHALKIDEIVVEGGAFGAFDVAWPTIVKASQKRMLSYYGHARREREIKIEVNVELLTWGGVGANAWRLKTGATAPYTTTIVGTTKGR